MDETETELTDGKETATKGAAENAATDGKETVTKDEAENAATDGKETATKDEAGTETMAADAAMNSRPDRFLLRQDRRDRHLRTVDVINPKKGLSI